MAWIDKVLWMPAYGWQDANGELVVPRKGELFAEFFRRINIFRSRKNWSAAIGWIWVLCLLPFPVLFITNYFSWWLIPVLFFYGGVIMSTHGTVWYHRYSTHRAFTFRNRFWRFVVQNLVVKVVPEEIYVVSHHVHHAKSDKPGDPYNAAAGFWYCFLADAVHQPIAHDLTEKEYAGVVKMLSHTGVKCNTYAQYKMWGSATAPAFLVLHGLFNWAFWFGVFYALGGMALATALFSGVLWWIIAIRTFNYSGHGKGRDKRRDGIDFNRRDLSINQNRTGWLAGEWHNNHHLYPSSARAGFLPYQFDPAWAFIYFLYLIGVVTSYHDAKEAFYKEYVEKVRS